MSGVEGQRRFAPAARDIGDALRFFTRVPVGDPGASAPLDINRFAWAAPVAGAVVGLIGALALALTGPLGLPPLMRAGLAGLDGFIIDDERGRRLEACQSPVWDSALAVVALADAGVDPEADHAVVRDLRRQM